MNWNKNIKNKKIICIIILYRLKKFKHNDKKIKTKLTKLIKYYNLINYNLIFSNKTINRYKSNNLPNQNLKTGNLEKLRKSLLNINNCDFKNNASNLVFSDGNPKLK